MTEPFNFSTLKQYQGENAVALSGPIFPAYATFNQVQDLGGRVKKGAKAIGIFCGYVPKEIKGKDGKTKQRTIPRAARVFHIDDCEVDPAYVQYIKDQIKNKAPALAVA